MQNAESQARTARREQGRGDPCEDHTDSQKRAGVDGSLARDIAVGIPREIRAGASLAGGILARLIRDAEDRLNEARECVEWYKREEQKQLERLREFQQLQESLELDEE